jgi:CRISPR system Cascade subunit CasC
MADSIKSLGSFRTAMESAYGPAADATAVMQVGGSGTLADIVAFVTDGG